jgi:hypothetical protein
LVGRHKWRGGVGALNHRWDETLVLVEVLGCDFRGGNHETKRAAGWPP